ncbi:MAG: alpha/beta hydrolase [Pelovirga sp.]
MQTEEKLLYRDVGRGPTVVLLHDFPLTPELWDQQAQALQDAGFRVILPDLSTLQTAGSIPHYARRVIALLNRLGLGRVAVCGMGMGGAILFDLLERHAQRIAGACFIATRPVPDDIQERARRAELVKSLLKEDAAAVREELLRMLLSGREKPLPERLQRAVRKMVCSYDRNVLINGLNAMAQRKDYTPLLDQLQLPTLVLGGEHDDISHPQHVTIMAAALPCCRGAQKLDAGHLVPLERPQEVNALLVDFFRSIAPRHAAMEYRAKDELRLAS